MKLTVNEIYEYLKTKFVSLQGASIKILDTSVLASIFKSIAWILEKIVLYVEYLYRNSFLSLTTSLSAVLEKIKEIGYFPRYYKVSYGRGFLFPKEIFPTSLDQAKEGRYFIYTGPTKNLKFSKLNLENNTKRTNYFIFSESILYRDTIFTTFTFSEDQPNSGESTIIVQSLGNTGVAKILILKDISYFPLLLSKLIGSYITFINTSGFDSTFKILAFNSLQDITIGSNTYSKLEIIFEIPLTEVNIFKTEKVPITRAYGLINAIPIDIYSGSLRDVPYIITGESFEKVTVFEERLSIQYFEVEYNGSTLDKYYYYITDSDPTKVAYALEPSDDYKSIIIKFSDGVFRPLLPANSTINIKYISADSENSDILDRWRTFSIADSDLNDFYVINIEPIVGYKKPESLEELKTNAIKFSTLPSVLITKDQLEAYISQNPLVNKVKVIIQYINNLYSIEKKIIAIVVPSTENLYLTNAQILSLLQYISPYKSVSDTIYISSPIYLAINFNSKLKINQGVDFYKIKSQLESYILKKFNFKNTEIGKSYYESNLISEISNSSSDILYHDSDFTFRYKITRPNLQISEDLVFADKNTLIKISSFKLFLRLKKDGIFLDPIEIANLQTYSDDYTYLSNINNFQSFNLNIILQPNSLFDTSFNNQLNYNPSSNDPTRVFTLQFKYFTNYQPLPNWYTLQDIVYNPSSLDNNGYYFYIEFKFCKLQNNQIVLDNDALAANGLVLFYADSDSIRISELNV